MSMMIMIMIVMLIMMIIVMMIMMIIKALMMMSMMMTKITLTKGNYMGMTEVEMDAADLNIMNNDQYNDVNDNDNDYIDIENNTRATTWA